MWDCRVARNGQGNNERQCFFLKKANGGSTFGGCFCVDPYTDGIPCHHMVAVVKSSRIEGVDCYKFHACLVDYGMMAQSISCGNK
jgi:hypothetical protein